MRLIMVVEGQTEERFVKDVLAPHLDRRAVYTSVTIVGKQIALARGHRRRGGGHYRSWRRDIDHILRRDRSGELRVTTLFDLYGLPDDFPGFEALADDPDTQRRRRELEAALAADVDDERFIPYIQLHEFEALVLAALPALRDQLDAPDDLAGLDELERAVGALPPEEVDDGPETAPSKRLTTSVPGYRKLVHGPTAIAAIGLEQLRRRCPRFDEWVGVLEVLSEP